MNWPRIILDGLSMSLLFNAVAGLGFLLVPQAYSTMFPREIRQAAAPFVEKKDIRTMKLMLYLLRPAFSSNVHYLLSTPVYTTFRLSLVSDDAAVESFYCHCRGEDEKKYLAWFQALARRIL